MTPTAALTYGSICSGIEAASVAWEPLGMRPAFFCEIEPFPCAVLAQRYPHVPNLGDFTALDVASLPYIDVLVGGTPCQSFSIAGKRLSLADARGNLTLAYTVLAHEIADRQGRLTVLWENVPGCLSTEDNAFGSFLSALVGGDGAIPVPRGFERWPDFGLVAGPRGRVVWRLLDAQWFGVAQRRERVFLVASLGDGIDPVPVLFEPQGLSGNRPACVQARQDIAALSARSPRPKSIWEALVSAFRAGPGDGAAHAADARQYGHRAVAPTLPARTGGGAGSELTPNSTGSSSRAIPLNALDDCSHAVVASGTASGTASGYLDPSAETFVGTLCGDIAHTLRADGFDASEDGTGRGTPLVAVASALKASTGGISGKDAPHIVAVPEVRGTMPAAGGTVRKHGHGWGQQEWENGYCIPVAFDTTQITSPDNRSNPRPGDPAPTLVKDMHAPPAVAFRITGNSGAWDVGDRAPSLTTGTDAAAITLVENSDVRRLTVVECERLQGFEPHRFMLTLSVWPSIDKAKISADADFRCRKLQSNVLRVEDDELSRRVLFADRPSSPDRPSPAPPVAASVRIDLERKLVELSSQEKLLLSATIAELSGEYHQSTHQDASVLQHARMLRSLVRSTQIGAAALHPKSKLFMLPLIGSASVHLCGSEMDGPAAGVDRSIAGLSEYLKSITCEDGANIDRFAWMWATWCCSAAHAISLFIPEKTRSGTSFSIEFSVEDSWTRVPVFISRKQPPDGQLARFDDRYELMCNGEWIRFAADGPRYKALGNSMAVPVMDWIGRRMIDAHAVPTRERT